MYAHGLTTVLEVEITPDTSAYADGDVIGGLQVAGPIPGAADGGMLLNSVAVVDQDNEGTALDIHIFDQAPASIADQAAFAPTYSDLCKRVRKVAIAAADWETENSLKVVHKEDLNDFIPSRYLWFYVVTNGTTPTFATGKKLYFRFFVG